MLPLKGKSLGTFISKAHTLHHLSSLLQKSYVEELVFFKDREWKQDSNTIIRLIQNTFKGETLIIRSSALGEDTLYASNAGCFMSILNIDSNNSISIETAIKQVLSSYKKKNAENADNLVLVQKQSTDISISGTILTRDYNGAPYYVLNYSEEDTTVVTSGRHSKSVKILKADSVKLPKEFKKLITAVKEIESLAPHNTPLDIEFGIKNNSEIVTFQVRPLAAAKKPTVSDKEIIDKIAIFKNRFKILNKRKPHLAGDVTYFGDMPDWNPAEIIGNSPHTLAVSLYDQIITDCVWHEARKKQGYTDVSPAKLVIQFGNKPYVDIRNTFNSFVPASIPIELKEKMLKFYLNKLKKHPHLQDKVEFEILFTCYDVSFKNRAKELKDAGFLDTEIKIIETSLIELTNNLLSIKNIQNDLTENEELEVFRKKLPSLKKAASTSDRVKRAVELIDACIYKGTPQFSRLARLAFVGKTLLKSLVTEGVIDSDTCYIFLGSIKTVTSQFAIDIDQLQKGKLSMQVFLTKYGHLRPGTYDITVPRYDMSDEYFSNIQEVDLEHVSDKEDFTFYPATYKRVTETLKKHRLTLNAQQLFEFVRAALEAREYSKFLFSRCLSEAIESIAMAGEKLGFSRDDLSNLDVKALRNVISKDDATIKKEWGECIYKKKAEYEMNSYISLPPVIFSEQDFEYITYYESRPNYITNKKVNGEIANVQQEITNKVVLLESADPGHDWIFTKKPLALITKYGGPASHMAIRCAELGLPAIIGAGELLFDTLINEKFIMLDCENQKIKPIGVVT